MTSPSATTTDDQVRQLQTGIRALVRRFSLAERADLGCCGMTAAQAATLQALASGDLGLSDLSKRLGITASTLTRNLRRLEDRGLVRRSSDPGDGRALRVSLTRAGREAAAEVDRQEAEFAREVLNNLPSGTAASTLAAIGRLLAAVRTATDACCPGAYDHLMADIPRSKGEGCHD